jgi:hypothetical protein
MPFAGVTTGSSKTNQRRITSRFVRVQAVPEAVELCVAALKSNKKTLVLAAAEFYENYRRGRNISLTPEMVERLDEIISKTKDRSVAVTALNLQVEAGLISELAA